MNLLRYLKGTKTKAPMGSAELMIANLDTWRKERGHIEQPLTYGPQCPKCGGWNTGPGEYNIVSGKTIFQRRCFSCYHGWGEQGVQLMEPADPEDIRLVTCGGNSTVFTAADITALRSPEVVAARGRLSKRKVFININEYFSR